MRFKKRLLAVAMAAVLLLSPITAAGAIGSTGANDSTANDSLVVAVEQAGNDGATVTVTHNDSAVENASVAVTSTNNSSYAGVGNYTTDVNGTVSLPEPEETVTVDITAAKGNLTGETTAEVSAEEREKKGTFGQMVSSFVQEMLNAGGDDGAIGQAISDFVTSNNPGADKKADHAGKPDDAGKSGGPDQSDTDSKNATEDDEDGDDEEEEEKGNSGNGKKSHGKDN